jgi:hypothetical protein
MKRMSQVRIPFPLPLHGHVKNKICHGVEGCLKQSMLWNKEVNQFGPWLCANSPTRRLEKTHDRHAENFESTKYAKATSEDGPKQSGA